MTGIRVGLARSDVTPPIGLPLDGYAGRGTPAERVLDPLFVRVLFASTSDVQVCVVSLDALGVGTSLGGRLRRAVARATGVAPSNIVVAASHTHAAPVGFTAPVQGDEAVSGYLNLVVERLGEAAEAARLAAVPCRVRYGSRQTTGIAASRTDPSAPVDSKVRVVRFVDASSGAPLGRLAHFACHPTVLGEENLGYSGDFVGWAVRRVEAGEGAPCLFVQGAAADVSTRFTRRARTPAEAQRLGGVLAEAIENASEHDRGCAPALALRRRRVTLPPRHEPSRDELANVVGAAQMALATLPHGDRESGAERLLRARLVGAQELARAVADGWPTVSIRTTLTGVRLADTVLTSVPGELFQATAEGIPGYGETWIPMTLANGYLGYFPTEAAVAAREYESLNTIFDAAATSALASGIDRLVATLSDAAAGLGREKP